MRIVFMAPLLLLGACQVSKDEANNTVSVTYNEDVAANAAEDVQNIAEDIGNEAKNTGEKIENKVGDVDVTVNRDVKTENKSQ